MKVGLLGGTFNPIHFGHLRAGEEVRERLGLDMVLFIPAGTPPLKSDCLASEEHRHKMASMAVDSNAAFEVSEIELGRKSPSYTVDTLKRFKEARYKDELVFIIGTDAFSEMHLWKSPEEIVSTVDFAVIGRPSAGFASLKGSPFLICGPSSLDALDSGEIDTVKAGLKGGKTAYLLALPTLAISATEIRKRIREGRSVKYLLPQSVESFIMSNRLYFKD